MDKPERQVLVRGDNLKIIEEIRNTERIGLDAYIENKLEPLGKAYPGFVETLYKDITYVLDGIDEDSEGDFELTPDGDFVLEDDDIKLSGYQTRLHDVCMWLHQQVAFKKLGMDMDGEYTVPFDVSNISKFPEEMEKFESNFLLNKKTYTVEYRKALDKIRNSIIEEKRSNYRSPGWTKLIKKIRRTTVVVLAISVLLFLLIDRTPIIIISVPIFFYILIIVYWLMWKKNKAIYLLYFKPNFKRFPINSILSLAFTFCLSFFFKLKFSVLDLSTIFGATYLVVNEIIVSYKEKE